MFWRRDKEVAVESGWEIPDSLLELLEILDAEYLILAPGEQVLSSSAGTSALSMIRDGRLVSTPLLNLVRAVRRSNVYQEATVELPRGPIGQGTHDLLVRVSPIGSDGLIVALIFDDSEFRLLDAAKHRGLARGNAAFGLELFRQENRAGLEDRFTEQHPRRDRVTRVVAGVERLVGTEGATTGGAIGSDFVDPVQEEERWAMRDGVENSLQHGHIFVSGETDKRHENIVGRICLLPADSQPRTHEDTLRHPPYVPPPHLR